MTENASNDSNAERAWWLCPNGTCKHGAVLHDIEEMDDPQPRCCVDDCDCGTKTGDR